MLTKDNIIVVTWVTAVKLMGYSIDQVPEICGLRGLVREVLEAEKDA